MIVSDKPNPFKVLGLGTDVSNADIVKKLELLSDLAPTDEEILLYRWAVEQLITCPLTRLQYELFEVPHARYEDPEWEKFARVHRRNPVSMDALVKDVPDPGIEDFDMANLIGLFLDGLLEIPEVDIAPAVERSPFDPDMGLPPLEVRDVIFG